MPVLLLLVALFSTASFADVFDDAVAAAGFSYSFIQRNEAKLRRLQQRVERATDRLNQDGWRNLQRARSACAATGVTAYDEALLQLGRWFPELRGLKLDLVPVSSGSQEDFEIADIKALAVAACGNVAGAMTCYVEDHSLAGAGVDRRFWRQ
jgi:hypothetical protein